MGRLFFTAKVFPFMKAVIPLAGRGTRLYPQTHTKPKAMIRIAGKPILGHILSSLAETEIEEAVLVVGGPMQTQIREYATDKFGDEFDFSFPEQSDPLGLGHAIYQARSAVDGEPILIALGDMLFERGYQSFIDAHEAQETTDGSIGTKRVDEPRHYGVVDVTEEGTVAALVEKPDDPPSDLAISGVYVIEDSESLFDALAHHIDNDIRGAGDEFQLTDALQQMVVEGASLRTFPVEDWYDCGRPETLLEANQVLLESMSPSRSDTHDEAVFIPPVDVGNGATIRHSIVGPNVSVDEDATIENSLIRNAIVGRDASLTEVNLEHSIIGDAATISGEAHSLNVGDNSDLTL